MSCDENLLSMLKLPSGYSYKVDSLPTEEPFACTIRIKEVNDEATAKKWLEDLADSSCATWRVTNSSGEGRINLFKQRLQCQHARTKNLKGVRRSKATGCEAVLHITVHRIVKSHRSKCPDRFDPVWRTVVKFAGTHNHSTSSAAVLKYRNMSESTRTRLLALFRQGHSASSALHRVKTDLLVEHANLYYSAAADGKHVPSLSIVDKLFRKEFQGEIGDIIGADALPATENMLLQNSNVDCCIFEPFSSRQEECLSSKLSNEQEQKLEDFFSRIKDGLERSGDVYVPAVTKMLQNIDNYAATETGFISALTTFAKSSGLQTVRRRRVSALSNRRHGVQIGVQPTAIGRRHHILSGKRKLVAGKAPGETQVPNHMVGHAYTTLRELPSC